MPDDDDNDVARLPRRAGAPSTRTDARAVQREVTSVTRPLFTADESAEDSVLAGGAAIGDADSGEDDDTDLFDAVATVAEVPSLPAIDAATRVSTVRQPLVADRNDVSELDGIDESEEQDDVDDDDDDDDEEEEEEEEPEGERTMVSIVVPEHLQASATNFDQSRPVDMTERSGLFDGVPDSIGGDDEVDAFVPKSTELVRTTPRTSTPMPGWLVGLLVFAGIVVFVGLGVAVMYVAS